VADDSGAGDSGAGDSGMNIDASDVDAANCTLTYQTSCSPSINVSTATHITGPIASYIDSYLSGPLPASFAVVDSLAALDALFSADAGAVCAQVAPPVGTDFTTQRVAVGYFDAAYDTGASIVLSSDRQSCGTVSAPGLAAIALPISNEPVVLMTCVTRCSAPPGCPRPA